MLRPLEYQERVWNAIDAYLDHLIEQKANAERTLEVARRNPDVQIAIPDFTANTWEKLAQEKRLPRPDREFSPHLDGCRRPVPNVVLKVPTAGGKTWIAINAVSRIMGRYLNRNTGFVLWIVPNEAIYDQTLKSLRNREHHYRLALDRAAAGRVLILEKSDPLNKRDVQDNLCVMLLMLQSANRQTKDALKVFQDRGDVHGFVPPEGNQLAHRRQLDDIGNLDPYTGIFPMVKESLGNVLRIIRPVVVLDEGHRATSDLAYDTLYGFNPCFVLELTATPKDVRSKGGKNPRKGRNANVLVEITGKELDREGMIKMPLNLDSRAGSDWRATLTGAVARLMEIRRAACEHRAREGRYIRPILLVQVERTGAEQRDGRFIHTEDVREWLLVNGFDEAEIAIKTANTNDLENQDLLSGTSRVCVIITKQALQEGWDCPFAYVLCSLSASTSLGAMTQLVGRVLRQPHAEKTEIPLLDESHVVTHHAETARVVEAIKTGLEREGLGDLQVQVSPAGDAESDGAPRRISRRGKFGKLNICLPRVMFAGDKVRELDYETDILSPIDWRDYDPGGVARKIPKTAQGIGHQMQQIRIGRQGEASIHSETAEPHVKFLTFDAAFATQKIFDLVLNPFVGREIVGRLVGILRNRGFDDALLGRLGELVIDELRRDMNVWRDRRAEEYFRKAVRAETIQFRLRLDHRNWRMPYHIETIHPTDSPRLLGISGQPVQKSLFDPVYKNELNREEREVAGYLDSEATLNWWHRNAARKQYGIQGWKKGKFYPDFIFSVDRRTNQRQLMILETKGQHLDNPDTEYKRRVLSLLSEVFRWDDCVPAGELEFENHGEMVQARLILMNEFRSELSNWMAAGRAASRRPPHQ